MYDIQYADKREVRLSSQLAFSENRYVTEYNGQSLYEKIDSFSYRWWIINRIE